MWKNLGIAFKWASLVVQTVNRLPAAQETRVRSLGWEDPLEKEMATHSSTLAWKIPWAEEPSRLQSMELQRVGHDWATSLSFTEPSNTWSNIIRFIIYGIIYLYITHTHTWRLFIKLGWYWRSYSVAWLSFYLYYEISHFNFQSPIFSDSLARHHYF